MSKNFIKEIKRKYNTSYEYAEQLYKLRLAGRCECCKIPPRFNPSTPHIDHCHKTGKVRGVVCASCNVIIGRIENNLPVLYKQCHLNWIKNH